MVSEWLKMHDWPKLRGGRLVLGFSGWMDGGEVSTGTISYLVSRLRATELAEIDPAPFYLYNFPGAMEIASLFRPEVKIEDGLITELDEPRSTFHCDAARNLVLFSGKEPNLRWREYAECILAVVADCNVKMACFVGSVAGLVPHTRDPRVFSAVSDKGLLPLLEQHGLTPSNYEGPASFVTYLTAQAKRHGLSMVSLVAEIPAYIQGRNPKCMAAVLRKVASLLDLEIDFSDLRTVSKEFEKRLNETVRDRPELEELIRKIEDDYDQQVFGAGMDGELKMWLERQGIRLD